MLLSILSLSALCAAKYCECHFFSIIFIRGATEKKDHFILAKCAEKEKYSNKAKQKIQSALALYANAIDCTARMVHCISFSIPFLPF